MLEESGEVKFAEVEKICRKKSGHDLLDLDTCFKKLGIQNPQYKYVSEVSEDHHLLHAWGALSQSEFEDASILVLDGHDAKKETSGGVYKATTVSGFPSIECVRKYNADQSLGILYSQSTEYCGFSENSEGKLMGLAPYGKYTELQPYVWADPETGDIHSKGNLTNELNEHLSTYFDLPGIEGFDFRYADVAAYIQSTFSDTVYNLVRWISHNLPSQNLIITGGCALNSTSNGEVSRNIGRGILKLKDIYIPPTCGDEGTSIGAMCMDNKKILGGTLAKSRLTYEIPKSDCVETNPSAVRRMLRRGEIVAFFWGGSEHGPRALCSRSLLADPRISSALYRLNEIKEREYWRPLAPVLREQDFDEQTFSNVGKGNTLHRFMLTTEKFVKGGKYPKFSPDGTARPQVLFRGDSPVYNILDEELPILINTSLNGKDQPIIETPEQAIRFCNKFSDVSLIFCDTVGEMYEYKKPN